jgi:hypothetical protein
MYLLRLRYTQPDLVRPIRVNLFWPILYLLATVFVTVVPMYASPVETGYGCLMILTSVPVYFLFIAWKRKPKSFEKAMGEYGIAFAIKKFRWSPEKFFPFHHATCKNSKFNPNINFSGAFNLLLQKLMMVVRPKSQQV